MPREGNFGKQRQDYQKEKIHPLAEEESLFANMEAISVSKATFWLAKRRSSLTSKKGNFPLFV